MKKGRINLELILSIAAIVIAAISVYVSHIAIAQNSQIACFQAFMDLRAEFAEIYKSFPPDYRLKGVTYPVDSPEWNSIKRYWYHSFNEWIITTRFGHSKLHDLWNQFYKTAICDAFEKDSMRTVFYGLKVSEFKSKMERQFVLEVETACKNRIEGAAK